MELWSLLRSQRAAARAERLQRCRGELRESFAARDVLRFLLALRSAQELRLSEEERTI